MIKKKKKSTLPEEICPWCHSTGLSIESFTYDYKCAVCEAKWNTMKSEMTYPTHRGNLNLVIEYFYEMRDKTWNKLGPIGRFLLALTEKLEDLHKK